MKVSSMSKLQKKVKVKVNQTQQLFKHKLVKNQNLILNKRGKKHIVLESILLESEISLEPMRSSLKEEFSSKCLIMGSESIHLLSSTEFSLFLLSSDLSMFRPSWEKNHFSWFLSQASQSSTSHSSFPWSLKMYLLCWWLCVYTWQFMESHSSVQSGPTLRKWFQLLNSYPQTSCTG